MQGGGKGGGGCGGCGGCGGLYSPAGDGGGGTDLTKTEWRRSLNRTAPGTKMDAGKWSQTHGTVGGLPFVDGRRQVV